MKFKLPVVLIVIFISSIFPQRQNLNRYITIVPGERYKAGWFYEFLFGKHWRDIWTTPITVPVLNLQTFAGGLIPLKKGGGYQTKSLRFKGNDGRIWKFRSVDKDPSKILPLYLQQTVAQDLVQDQISTSNPLAPMIVVPMLRAVNVLEAEPELVFLPDDERLGEFRKEFGGILGFIEVHPDEGENDDPGFANALDVKGTYKLLDHLEKKRSQRIDAEEFLKARLMDILFGDWDRHMDQWRWAKYKEVDGKVWEPIPRDRDQAFSKYDGLFPSVAAYLIPQLNNFGYDYPQIEDLTWNGRFIDRRVLTELDKKTWDSVTVFVKSNITDDVINESVNRLPPEIYVISAKEISSKLKSRRSQLQRASNEFYDLVNKYADVFCSTKDDYVEVNRVDDKSTEVTVYKRDKKTGDKKDEPLFHKIFDNSITVEIRIYLNDGDDLARVIGECNESPVIKIIGGNGKDEFVDESIVHGYFFSITPFKSVQTKTYFYDSGDKTKVTLGGGTDYDNHHFPEPENDMEKYEPTLNDRGHNWLPVPVLGLSNDYGLRIGGGVQLNKYNFRAVPQEYKQQLVASIETRFGNLAAAYDGIFYNVLRNLRLNLQVGATEQLITRYFGYGNETKYSKTLESSDYYRVDQRRLTIFPSISYEFSKKITGSFGVSLIQTKSALVIDTLLYSFRYGEYGKGILDLLGFHLGLDIEGRDNLQYPRNGYLISMNGSVYPDVFNTAETYYKAEFDLRGYITPEPVSFSTLALRVGGSRVWGKYPFFDGAAIGGKESLRGYLYKRFSGDVAIFGQAEMRLSLADINIILKSRFGITLFAEAGRVFILNTPSKQWHPSYGFGIWSAYLGWRIIGSTFLAFSPEKTTIGIGFGMAF